MSKHPVNQPESTVENDGDLACTIAELENRIHRIEPPLDKIINYLMNFNISDLDHTSRTKVRQNAMKYAV